MAESANVIMDGRDICSYVLPNADVKIFLPRRLNQERKEDMTNFAKKALNVILRKLKPIWNIVTRTILKEPLRL